MDFYIVELSGQHHRFQGATEGTTIKDIRKFMAHLLNLTDYSRVLLIHSGSRLDDDSVRVISLGLTAETASSFRFHAIVKFKAPQYLFDGQPHPFLINDISIRGDRRQPMDFLYNIHSYLNAVAFSGGKQDGNVNEIVEQSLTALAKSNHVNIPQCIRSFLCNSELVRHSQSYLSLQPLIITDHTTYWGAPSFVHISPCQSALLFMMDHQGCCYWYAVWIHADNDTRPITSRNPLMRV